MASDAGKHALTEKDAKQGAWVREETKFRGTIVEAKEADESGRKFAAEKGRYHLYVSLACPWACRTLIVASLKGLHNFNDKTSLNSIDKDGKNVATGKACDDIIHVNIVHPYLRNYDTPQYVGWEFRNVSEADEQKSNPEKYYPGNYKDPLNGFDNLWQLYDLSWKKLKNDKTVSYPQKYITVPCLFDSHSNQIVNNESAEIIEILNSQFNQFIDDKSKKELNLSPNDENIQKAMKDVNDWVYPNINDGVYRCGFAKAQPAYNKAYVALFENLDKLEQLLSEKDRKYVADKNQITLSDVRLFTTLVRFDPVYYTHFKCNKRTLRSYPHIWEYTKRVYQLPGVKETVDIDHIKYHYYYSHAHVNPRQIIPKGPQISYD